ncbi:MAG: hypothetical protein M5U28_54670 [Sandaracinaceae bacterium]|nr:hypothetical protein [Sandaracinaceae bacterium]
MSAGARGSWTLVAATAALALSACEPVAIYGRIVPEGEPVRVVPGEGELGGIAVGLLDEHTLVEWMRPGVDYWFVPTIQWFDADFEREGASVELGLGYRIPSQWARDRNANALLSQVWATPLFDPAVRDDQWVHLWRIPPPPEPATSRPVAVEATQTADPLHPPDLSRSLDGERRPSGETASHHYLDGRLGRARRHTARV